MTIEAGVLVNTNGEPIFWHTPGNRNVVALPDSRDLWDVMWENRKDISGFAHTHPGSGWPGPSWTDVTTFSAVELALGRRIYWWIASSDQYVSLLWKGPGKYDYEGTKMPNVRLPMWMAELRRLSHF